MPREWPAIFPLASETTDGGAATRNWPRKDRDAHRCGVGFLTPLLACPLAQRLSVAVAALAMNDSQRA